MLLQRRKEGRCYKTRNAYYQSAGADRDNYYYGALEQHLSLLEMYVVLGRYIMCTCVCIQKLYIILQSTRINMCGSVDVYVQIYIYIYI